jgi:hypothetical protein
MKRITNRALSVLKQRIFAILSLIIAYINDLVNGTVERSYYHLLFESLSKLFILLDICMCATFCLFKQTLEEEVEEMDLRIREENHVLTARTEENSSLNERIWNIKQLYKENLNLIQNN